MADLDKRALGNGDSGHTRSGCIPRQGRSALGGRPSGSVPISGIVRCRAVVAIIAILAAL